jgi:cyclohexadienyl dehydratase
MRAAWIVAACAAWIGAAPLPALSQAQAQPAAAPPAVAMATPAATSRLDQILARGVLRVGLTGDYRPFGYRPNPETPFEGFDVDMAKALGEALGVKVEFVPTSWPTLMRDFEADAFDMAAGGVSITLDRQKKGLFSLPIMREGKTPIARCSDAQKFQTLEQIDRPETRVIVNPGGTNERFARARLRQAPIEVWRDNNTIFEQIAAGRADVMMTDASETRYQQKLHPGVLCAVHPDTPFDFAEKAYWLQRDVALKAFVDQWLHIAMETGAFKAVYDRWFN